MAKERIFVTRMIPQSGLDLLQSRFEVEVWPEYAPPPREVMLEKLRSVQGMVSLLSDKIDKQIFEAAPELKIVAQYAVGYDNIDIAAATKRGVYVTNTPEVLTDSSADFAWALLMAVARRVVEADRYVRQGNWQVAWHPAMMLGMDIHGATIGIVGAGRIGQAVARRARGFNMNVIYFSHSPKPEFEAELGAKRVELGELFAQADFVSLHVPLTEQTKQMVNAHRLGLMKKTAFLINNARGAVIDEKALFAALRDKRIAGAALDVFAIEPTPKENPLLTLDNLVVAPHISSASYATRDRMAEMVAENIIACFENKDLPDLVNTEVIPL